MKGKNTLLMYSLKKFYKNQCALDKLINILEGNDKISLRIIDWFVTNYAKKYNVVLHIKGKNPKFSDSYLIVYLNYKSQLKAYSKKQFDPFCRRNRIEFFYDEKDLSKKITTTVGQLNFFKWFIQNNLYEYVIKHLSEIEKDMNNALSKTYNRPVFNKKKRKPRKELSKSATNTINKYNIYSRFEFN